MTQDRLKKMLAPPVKGKPLELSTETPTISDAKTHHRTIVPTEQYKRVNRGYKLREDLIKACKLRALEQDKMLYQVMEEALTEYLEGTRTTALENEIQQLRQRLKIEERFRTDTQVYHFKKWLRSHDQPQDSDFAQRFLVDSRLPQHASRSLYEAKMRTTGYSEEDMHLFQDAWKSMIAEDLE
jgi:hypothetical protein